MAKNLKEELKKIAKEQLFNGKHKGLIEMSEFSDEPCFKASTSLNNSNINIRFNPDYIKECPGKIDVVIRDITRHEINHKKYGNLNGCPRTTELYAEKIIEPMAQVLQPKGYNENDLHYIGNALTDTILHADLSQKFNLEGIVNFFEDIGRHMPYTKFYEAHVLLNMYFWGNKQHKKTLKKHLGKHGKVVSEVIQNFLKKSGLISLSQSIELNYKEMEIRDRQTITEFINDEENWPKIAKAYAEEFSKLMEPGYALPLQNHSGQGTNGFGNKQDENDKDGSSSGQSSEDDYDNSEEDNKNGNTNIGNSGNLENEGKDESWTKEGPIEGNQFDKEMYSDKFKKKRINKAYANGEHLPEWINYYDGLNLLYQSLAQKLNIRVETFTKQSQMPIYYYGSRKFDPERDTLKRIKFGFNGRGELELRKKRWHEDIPIEYKINQKGFPEVRFCFLDTSGSMQEPAQGDDVGNTNIIPWGDNSRYHYALLAWYGLLEYLKQNHLLKQTNIGLANFSNETNVENGLEAAKRLAFSPQWGYTILDMGKIKKVFNGRNALVFTISDGGIQNWDEIEEEFIKLVKQHYYFHLQIGPHNVTSMALKNAGLYVEQIRNANDLVTKVIDLTDKLYRC